MKESTSKEKVLKSVRNALISKQTNPYQNMEESREVFQPIKDSLDVTFAEAFTKLGGSFVYCSNYDECLEALSYISKKEKWEEVFTYDPGLKQLLSHSGIKVEDEEHEFENLRIGATRCEVLLARTGTILTSSLQGPGRRINTWPEIHLVFAEIHQLLPDLKEGIDYITNKYSKDKLPSDIKFISGPSRTADIEKTLVMGAHGPREIYVFLVDNQ